MRGATSSAFAAKLYWTRRERTLLSEIDTQCPDPLRIGRRAVPCRRGASGEALRSLSATAAKGCDAPAREGA